MFFTDTVLKMKIHILCPVTYFFENHAVYEKDGRAKQATDDSTI
jgi:hypothetical protein